MDPLDGLERRHIEEQFGGVRDELAEMRAELQLIRNALVRARAEMAGEPETDAQPQP